MAQKGLIQTKLTRIITVAAFVNYTHHPRGNNQRCQNNLSAEIIDYSIDMSELGLLVIDMVRVISLGFLQSIEFDGSDIKIMYLWL